MLRVYGPTCDGSLVEAGRGSIPPGATWIDLEEPTREEEKVVEQALGIAVPTRDDLVEIEPSSRLYEKNGTLYMTLATLTGVVEGKPTSEPIGFVLAADKLVTIRYANPKPVRAFVHHANHEPELVRDALTVLIRLLDAILDRLADELEGVAAEIERISHDVFAEQMDERRVPVRALTALLTRVGRAQSLLTRARETAVSASRLLGFLLGSDRMHQPHCKSTREHLLSLQQDAAALSDHSNFLVGNLGFLMDAALGLISVEQNAAMKVFSWASLVFLPPTLIAGVYGMNFEFMPELSKPWGYPLAGSAMVASAVLPIWYLRRRGLI
uniref:magnesium transporter CorA family protein n=1 Tax=uncultured Sphingomonas sp. TaxID=158754 RepID=UPI0025FE34C5|nr:magnesium transporter CorA family protein [uncultured Sphingomonas sp.]